MAVIRVHFHQYDQNGVDVPFTGNAVTFASFNIKPFGAAAGGVGTLITIPQANITVATSGTPSTINSSTTSGSSITIVGDANGNFFIDCDPESIGDVVLFTGAPTKSGTTFAGSPPFATCIRESSRILSGFDATGHTDLLTATITSIVTAFMAATVLGTLTVTQALALAIATSGFQTKRVGTAPIANDSSQANYVAGSFPFQWDSQYWYHNDNISTAPVRWTVRGYYSTVDPTTATFLARTIIKGTIP